MRTCWDKHKRKTISQSASTNAYVNDVLTEHKHNVPVNSKTAHAPPPHPGQTPGHFTFLKNFGQIPRYVAGLDGQMLHPLELQRGSNPQPSRHVKANCGDKFCKIFNHYEFIVQLVFAPHSKQRHIP